MTVTELSRLGGNARRESLTSQRRSEIASKASRARWNAVRDKRKAEAAA